MDKNEILQKYFGYSAFRPGQEQLIDAILNGRDVFGIMPTGGGKSLCYQVPALMLPGVTLVVSPLISLMKDQVMALKNAGVNAAYINSSLTPGQIGLAYRNMRVGMYKIIYVAPERLLTDGFLETVSELKISMLAVDESHCISQWGQDFRPSYVQIPEFVRHLPKRPVVSAFTATATERVRQDVERLLELREPLRIVTGFDRPNLCFRVETPKDKQMWLNRFLENRRDQCGIVYCSTRKEVETVCHALCQAGFSASRYHAGLPDEERRKNQEDFVFDRCAIMVATNAFGMGIDKSNVSFVVHYNMPQSLEAYYQEAGRAGRDGAEAECVLLFSRKDIVTARYLIEHPGELPGISEEIRQEQIRQNLVRMNQMADYCKTRECLRGYILDYFGESHPPKCGNCGNCLGDYTQVDITTQAKMVLSCVWHVREKLGYCPGTVLLCQCLRGGKSKRLLELGLNGVSTYGIGRAIAEAHLREIVEALDSQGYLEIDESHGGISLTGKASDVLFRKESVWLRLPTQEVKQAKAHLQTVQADGSLLTQLKALRIRLASTAHIPAYMVFSNATLQDMAEKQPDTPEEFRKVSGVGAVKAEKYGDVFLEEIQNWKQSKLQ